MHALGLIRTFEKFGLHGGETKLQKNLRTLKKFGILLCMRIFYFIENR